MKNLLLQGIGFEDVEISKGQYFNPYKDVKVTRPLSEIVLACIDGDVLPSGTCGEIGKFHEKIERGDHKYIVGICTDNRQMYLTHSEAKNIGGASALGEQQYSYQNLYVTGLIKQGGILVTNIEDAIEFIKTKAGEFDE